VLTDVLVPVITYPEDAATTSLTKLTNFLGSFADHVTYCALEIDVPALNDHLGSGLLGLGQMAAEIEERSRNRAADLLAALQAESSKLRSETVSLRAAPGTFGLGVARQARHHDLTAISMRKGSADQQAIAEDILFGSGRPLLLAPEALEYDAALNRLAIAWDGGQTAARAVYDAMPLIVKANEVVVLTANADKPIQQVSVAALMRYLERHGAGARLVEASSSGSGIGADLQSAAKAEQASLLVMGAYGHSRLREFVLGGATAGVLRGPTLPVFMSR
jgi:nucleotide-binding universal stress UspA family protein